MTPHQKTPFQKEIRKIGTWLTGQEAQEMISGWQSQEPDGICSFLYGRHIFEKILAAPACEGIRIFNGINGINGKGDHALVFIGVNAAGKHIFRYQLQTSEGVVDIFDPIMDQGLYCPFDCLVGSRDLDTYLWDKTDRAPLDLSQTGKSISREKAQEMISTWQNQEPDAVFSFLYGREVFDAILNVPGCAGIRVFNGINKEGRQALVLVGVDARGGNIMQYRIAGPDGLQIKAAPLADGGIPCPPFCPPPDFGIYSLGI